MALGALELDQSGGTALSLPTGPPPFPEQPVRRSSGGGGGGVRPDLSPASADFVEVTLDASLMEVRARVCAEAGGKGRGGRGGRGEARTDTAPAEILSHFAPLFALHALAVLAWCVGA